MKSASVFFLLLLGAVVLRSDPAYIVCVSNERSGDVTLIDGRTQRVIATVPVGKRPRGIHASPDGQFLYVAVSGTPIAGPPKLDANGNPIFERNPDEKVDAAADGIAVVDLRSRKFLRKIASGSDPEEFAVSADGRRLYISNEDIATASVRDAATGSIEHTIAVREEPEGVVLSPDGRRVYVTCETEGEIFVIDTKSNKAIADFKVGGRPRTVAFLPDSSQAFIPSESAGTLHVIDTTRHAVLDTIKLPAGSRPMGTAVSSDGAKLYVSTGRAGTICVIDAKSHRVLNTINVGKRPWGISISPDGRHLYVANGPSNDVSVIDLSSETELTRIPVGQSPWGVAVIKVAAPAVSQLQ